MLLLVHNQLKVSLMIIFNLFLEKTGFLWTKLSKEDKIKYMGIVTSSKLGRGVEMIKPNEQRCKIATGQSAVFCFTIENKTEESLTGGQCQVISLHDKTFRQSK